MKARRQQRDALARTIERASELQEQARARNAEPDVIEIAEAVGIEEKFVRQAQTETRARPAWWTGFVLALWLSLLCSVLLAPTSGMAEWHLWWMVASLVVFIAAALAPASDPGNGQMD